jgi:hypothetical protein
LLLLLGDDAVELVSAAAAALVDLRRNKRSRCFGFFDKGLNSSSFDMVGDVLMVDGDNNHH